MSARRAALKRSLPVSRKNSVRRQHAIVAAKPKEFQALGRRRQHGNLRPVPSANLFVPYSVTIPTTIGTAVMSAESVNITSSNNTVIALSQ
jgi:hypothetical protein